MCGEIIFQGGLEDGPYVHDDGGDHHDGGFLPFHYIQLAEERNRHSCLRVGHASVLRGFVFDEVARDER